ncbi:MAG: lysophospholipid acyltransferase family protein [Pseudomonadota bacterium]
MSAKQRSLTWKSTDLPDLPPLPPLGHAWALLRVAALVPLFLMGTAMTLALRVVERLFLGKRRVLTLRVMQAVFRLSLRIMGLVILTDGAKAIRPGPGARAIVANHASWLDILVLGAAQPVVFVSKADVADWPVIGALARMVGTVFIARDPRQAALQKMRLAEALAEGQVLVLFPEGTSTDGLRVLRFKSTLMAAFDLTAGPQAPLIQPVTVQYSAPDTIDEPRFYAWWGDMALAPHLWSILGQSRQGHVTITRHELVRASDFEDRKTLSAALEAAVRAGMPEARRGHV